MRSIFLFILFCVISLETQAQKPYFQQRVDYEISAKLDDNSHILRGYEEFEYTNNSPDTLKFLFIHLWPNAYRNDRTAFAKQQVENGDTKFYFSEKNERGFIDSLSFRVDGFPVQVGQYGEYIDVAMLDLPGELLPGEKVNVSTPFKVVIPKNFSRLGHEGQSYQMTQWYPKPAVYDHDGWHPMPYLDQGEFYSEYGSFDVTLTVPENYVVAATGELQNEKELKFLNELSSKNKEGLSKKESEAVSIGDIKVMLNGGSPSSRTEIPSSKNFKTLQWKQDNVHDFAWFADKSFQVEKLDFKLPSGKECTAWSYYTPNNKSKYIGSTKISAGTVQYLSEHVGEYPYRHVSVIDGPLYAGGGMEYPMITILGTLPSRSLVSSVIVHEVGHNWFQGLLGSNERMHPWLDEGVNSFYENLICVKLKKDKLPVSVGGGNEIVYQLNGASREDQPIDIPSEQYSYANYGGVVYAKAAKSMAYLQQYIGEDKFEKGMKSYFNDWHYKHPGPKDLQASLENAHGKSLSWFFDDYLKSAEAIDYKIVKAKRSGNTARVHLKNKFDGSLSVPVSAMNGEEVVETVWSENEVAIFENLNANVTSYKVDEAEIIPETNTKNNSYRPNAFFKRGAPKVGLGLSIGTGGYNKAFLAPAIGHNIYDGFMLGPTLHNLSIPNKDFQFAVAPMYAFRSKSIVGTGVMGYSLYPKAGIKKITFSLQGSTFHSDSSILNVAEPVYTRHYKLRPGIEIELPRKTHRSPTKTLLSVYAYVTAAQNLDYVFYNVDSVFRVQQGAFQERNFFRVNYSHVNSRTFNPFSYEVNMDGNGDFLKLGLEGRAKLDYNLKKKGLYVRAFAGKYFSLNDDKGVLQMRPFYLNVTPTADNDYGYDNYFLARNEFAGWRNQQVLDKEGGFATRTTQYASPIGVSDDWLVSLNLRSDIPINFPILPQVFFNAATFANAGRLNPSGSKMVFEGGLSLRMFRDLVRIDFPLLLSTDFKAYSETAYPKNKLLRQISFSINTHKLNFLKTQTLTELAF